MSLAVKTTRPLPRNRVLPIAQVICNRLRPVCKRIEIAGSLRRQCSTVRDIDIVLIPERVPDLLGEEGPSLLDREMDAMVDEGKVLGGCIMRGEKHKRFWISPVQGLHLDLWIVRPETWGVLFAIRTGPAEYSHRLVTQEHLGGLLRDDLIVRDGRVWAREGVDFDFDFTLPLDTPEETDFLFLAGGIKAPWDRD